MLSTLLDHGHDIRALTELPRQPGLHCMARSIGYEQRINETYAWDGMQRGTQPFLVIQHTTLGEGRLDYEGARHRLRPGDLMLVTAPHAHRYWLDRGGRWEYFWLVLDGREALRLAQGILAARGPLLHPDAAIIDRLAAACLALLTLPRPTPGEVSGLAYQAMTALHDAAFANRDPRPDLPAAIQRVLDHIDQNLALPLTIDGLAAIAGMSRAHFVRSFTSATGAAPSAHVMARRLERIERLLLATEMTVSDIAAAAGLADGNYLAKVFRRHRGMPPLAYRATRAESAAPSFTMPEILQG